MRAHKLVRRHRCIFHSAAVWGAKNPNDNLEAATCELLLLRFGGVAAVFRFPKSMIKANHHPEKTNTDTGSAPLQAKRLGTLDS